MMLKALPYVSVALFLAALSTCSAQETELSQSTTIVPQADPPSPIRAPEPASRPALAPAGIVSAAAVTSDRERSGSGRARVSRNPDPAAPRMGARNVKPLTQRGRETDHVRQLAHESAPEKVTSPATTSVPETADMAGRPADTAELLAKHHDRGSDLIATRIVPSPTSGEAADNASHHHRLSIQEKQNKKEFRDSDTTITPTTKTRFRRDHYRNLLNTPPISSHMLKQKTKNTRPPTPNIPTRFVDGRHATTINNNYNDSAEDKFPWPSLPATTNTTGATQRSMRL